MAMTRPVDQSHGISLPQSGQQDGRVLDTLFPPASANIRLAALIVSAIVSCVIAWPSLHSMMMPAYHDDQYTHVLFVFPVSVCLIVSKLIATRIPISRRTTAGLLISISTILTALSTFRDVEVVETFRLSLTIFVLVLCWLGLVIVAYGLQFFKALLFPLLYLFLMVPLPQPAIDRVVDGLQVASLHASFALFKLVGVPVVADGMVLSLPSLDIEIARQCSGIRSSMVLVLAGLLAQYGYLRSGWTKAIFVLSIVPFAIVKNAIRIVTLSLLAIHVDPGFLDGRLHHDGGIVFFLLTLGALLLWLKILQRAEARKPIGFGNGPMGRVAAR